MTVILPANVIFFAHVRIYRMDRKKKTILVSKCMYIMCFNQCAATVFHEKVTKRNVYFCLFCIIVDFNVDYVVSRFIFHTI